MDLNCLATIRAERTARAEALADLRADVVARLDRLEARLLSSPRRAGQFDELRRTLALIDGRTGR